MCSKRLSLFIGLFLLCVIVFSNSTIVSAATKNLIPEDDTYKYISHTGWTDYYINGDGGLGVPPYNVNCVGCYDGDGGNDIEETALRFDLSNIIGTVTSANLRIYIVDKQGAPGVSLYSSDDDSWSEEGATKFPSTTNQMLLSYTSASIPSTDAWISFNVTNFIVAQATSDDLAVYGIIKLQKIAA